MSINIKDFVERGPLFVVYPVKGLSLADPFTAHANDVISAHVQGSITSLPLELDQSYFDEGKVVLDSIGIGPGESGILSPVNNGQVIATFSIFDRATNDFKYSFDFESGEEGYAIFKADLGQNYNEFNPMFEFIGDGWDNADPSVLYTDHMVSYGAISVLYVVPNGHVEAHDIVAILAAAREGEDFMTVQMITADCPGSVSNFALEMHPDTNFFGALFTATDLIA